MIFNIKLDYRKRKIYNFGISKKDGIPMKNKIAVVTSARKKSFEGDDIYNGRISRGVEGMEKDEQKGMSAETAGKYIAKIALKNKVKPVYTIGIGYKILSVLCKIFPCGIRNHIVGTLYAK